MKIVKRALLIEAGSFCSGIERKQIGKEIDASIKRVQWPPGSGSFTLHDQSGKKRGEGNGVKPIKDACVLNLKDLGWLGERQVISPSYIGPGPFDAVRPMKGTQFDQPKPRMLRLRKGKLLAFEWETGNISSTHRALNKMALGIVRGALIGGVLVLPTRSMYRFLTDRVGNFDEIAPYFPLWGSLKVREGLLEVIAIEHDGVSKKVARIPKGTDGRALQ